MVLEKRQLNLEAIEAQTALELPDRETLATLVLSCIAVCVGQIQLKDITIPINVDIQDICVQINAALAVLSPAGQIVACSVK